MDHFNLAKLKKTITIIQHRKEYEIENVADDYCIHYVHHMENPAKDFFKFTGIPKGKHFKEILLVNPNLETLLKKIHTLYPAMKPEDWETYTKLKKEMKDKSMERYYTNNEQTQEEEDKAIKKFCEFRKKHGL